MSPAFINTLPHEVYFVDPERQDDRTSEASGLLRVAAESEFEVASGRIAEEAEKVPGVVKANSKEAREFTKKGGTLDQRNIMRSSSGPDVFPVPEDQRSERSGLHITGRDSGVPVAADAEPGDTKDGSGEDHFKGIAAVEQGKVTRGDVPKAVAEEPDAKAVTLAFKDRSVKDLKQLAKDRNITVKGSGKKGSIRKSDLVSALEGAGGEDSDTPVQTPEASKTEKSDAVSEPGGTLTTDKDPSTGNGAGAVGQKPKRRSRSSSRKRSSKSKSKAKSSSKSSRKRS